MALARFVNILVGRAYEIDKFDISEFFVRCSGICLICVIDSNACFSIGDRGYIRNHFPPQCTYFMD